MSKVSVRQTIKRIDLVRGYDLTTSFYIKQEESSEERWTAFVNRAHTLVHLVRKDAEFMIRFKLRRETKGKGAMKTWSDIAIINHLLFRLEKFINF